MLGNTGLVNTLDELFTEFHKADRPIIPSESVKSPLCLAGFATGDGIFYIKPVHYKGNL